MTRKLEETMNFSVSKALEKYGHYNTRELQERLSNAINHNPKVAIAEIIDTVALCSIINGDIFASPRTHGFLHLHDMAREETEKSLASGVVLSEENSILWVRGAQLTREPLDLWEKVATRFVEWMREKNTWVEEFFGVGAIAHLHPYVQVRVLDKAAEEAGRRIVNGDGMKWTATVTMDEKGNISVVKQ